MIGFGARGTPATPADILLWGTWLAAARLAYHNLMVGETAVEIAVDGATFVTKFAKPDANKLAAYIARLEGQIASAGTQRPHAIGLRFN